MHLRDVFVHNMKGFKNFDASQESKRKRERHRSIILNEPGKYFPFVTLQKCFDVSQGSIKTQKETVKQFWVNLGNISVISLKESLMK